MQIFEQKTANFSTLSKAQAKMIRSLRLKKYRDEAHRFVAEGSKCIGELAAVADHREPLFEPLLLVIRQAANTPSEESLPVWVAHFPQVVCAAERDMAQLSSFATPSDYLAVFAVRPSLGEAEDILANPISEPTGRNLVLALDGIQDPGNLGTIIRTADWMGIHHIVCSPQTADCFSPKVVQATMGALTRVRIAYTDLALWLRQAKQRGFQVVGTTMDGRNIYTDTKWHQAANQVVVMGNEGQGMSEAVRRCCNLSLSIPAQQQAHVESLNVAIATAIILSEYRRRQKKPNF